MYLFMYLCVYVFIYKFINLFPDLYLEIYTRTASVWLCIKFTVFCNVPVSGYWYLKGKSSPELP